jgi:hypothetical protein
MKRLAARLLGVLLLLVLARPVAAQQTTEYPGLETGKMWTFDVPPLDYWAKRYDFRPTTQWLDHMRMSALRQPGCTASFVSANGLVLTNHHCARRCIESVTREGEDLLTDGFYARTPEEERPCQGFTLDQLLAIRDVTDSVNAAVPATAAPTQAAELRATAITGIQDRCAATGQGLYCQVVSMYRGGQFKLYTFRRYTDVRLVFAPEGQAAFFGGDPDNFTYPRHDLDLSIYRAYDNGQPVHTDYFKWAANGSKEGDLVFVVGNPGSTGRLNTMAQLEYLRDVQYPAQLDALARQIAVYHAIGNADPERAKAFRNTVFGLENSQKAIKGYQSGLLDPKLMAQKQAWEQNFRAKVNADANLKKQYGDAWDQIAQIRHDLAGLDVQRRFYGFNALGSDLLSAAGVIVRYPIEMAKPEGERARMYRGGGRMLDRALGALQSVDKDLETRLLTAYFSEMAAALPATDPVRRAALGNRTPEAAAAAMVSATTLTQAGEARRLMDGGASAIAASSDPFIVLARVIEPLDREISAKVNTLQDREAQQDTRIARALLAVFGNSVAPDATFSLRISDGEVKRYPYNGTEAAPYTTFYGLFDRWAGFSGQEPWNLTPRWLAARDKLDLATPLDAVSTNDIIGGNSGSPVVSRNGEIVGLIFDGNIEMLPNRFLFTEAVSRSVWVDVRAIIEGLRKVYDAGPLADELLGAH